MRPPRNGPTLRQTSPVSRSGLMGVAAMEMAATEIPATVREITRFVFMRCWMGGSGGLICESYLLSSIGNGHFRRELSRLQSPGDFVSIEDDSGRKCLRADEREGARRGSFRKEPLARAQQDGIDEQ